MSDSLSSIFPSSAELMTSSEADPEILKRAGLYAGHHGWPTKKLLGFKWSTKAKITLEAVSFRRNISISVLKFSPFCIQ